jgi:hypothetical protein
MRCSVAAAIAVLGCLLWLVSAQEKTDSPYTLADFSGIQAPTKENKLPDLNNPAVRKQLGCSVCRGVVFEVRDQLMERWTKRKDGPKPRLTELDIAEVTDGFCERAAKDYNLMTLDNQPNFKEGERRSEMGYWVSQFFELRCSEILEHREGDMLKHFREQPDQFLARICNDCNWKMNALNDARQEVEDKLSREALQKAAEL